MYYRRKILLALIETFGGNLQNTDCEKLLFLLCKRVNKNFYDFFPHKYGGFSIISYQDKNRLAGLDYLVSQENFQLNYDWHTNSILESIQLEDKLALQNLKKEVGKLRGNDLVKKIYLEFPEYAQRSEIASGLLGKAKYEEMKKTWNDDSNRCLFTLGYEGLTIDAFLNILINQNIKFLVDVRNNPISMKYGFSKNQLQISTKRVEIEYIHIPELGIPSELRRGLSTMEEYDKLFDLYKRTILPSQHTAIDKVISILANFSRVALTCFEANPYSCHRHKIIEYFANMGEINTEIVHLQKNDKDDTLNKHNVPIQQVMEFPL